MMKPLSHSFSGVDLSKIIIGSQIPAYEAIGDDFVPMSEIVY